MNQIKNNSFLSGTDFRNATGVIPYNMTNDYMFRAVLQKNNKVLKGLICALLHLEEQEVVSVTITNPIILGNALFVVLMTNFIKVKIILRRSQLYISVFLTTLFFLTILNFMLRISL